MARGYRRRGLLHQPGDLFDHSGIRRSHHQAVHPLLQNPQGGAGRLDVAHLHKDVAALRHQVFQRNDGPVRGLNHHRPLAGQADDFGFVFGAQDRDLVQVLPRHQVAVGSNDPDQSQGLDLLAPAGGDPDGVGSGFQGRGDQLFLPGVHFNPDLLHVYVLIASLVAQDFQPVPRRLLPAAPLARTSGSPWAKTRFAPTIPGETTAPR